MFPPYYFSNSVGCDRKLCKNSEQYASLFVPIICPHLLTLISLLPSFPSILQGGTSGLVNMFTHIPTACAQIICGLDALEAWILGPHEPV